MKKNVILEKLNKPDHQYFDLTDKEKIDIADNMLAEWEKIKAKWGEPTDFGGLAEDKYKEKIADLGECFKLYLTDKVKEKTIQKIYNELFGDVNPSEKPFLIIVAGAIASGKSTVIKCAVPAKYGTNYAVVDKDVIKASNIFRSFIHKKFGDEHGNLIEDFMLKLRDTIGEMAIKDKRSILLEQSCKSDGFLKTCKLAKNNGFRIYAEIVITPIAFTCVRNVYRYVDGLKKNPKTARYEAFVNIKDTYENAPDVLTKLQPYIDNGDMTVYTSDILKVDIKDVEKKDRPIAEVFDEVANGPVSDISYEIATRIYNHIYEHIDLVKHIPDVLYSLSVTAQKLLELAKNPDMITRAMPQEWQPQSVLDELDELNKPLGKYSYSKRLEQNRDYFKKLKFYPMITP